MTIWANTLVKNEERYIWFAVLSIIEYVDRILIWDTGSTDKTPEIIKEIRKLYPKKVEFREVGAVTTEEFSFVRQEMLMATLSDWFIILDGDEVWWEDSVRRVTETIKKEGNYLDTIVSPFYNVAGDIYHYQEEAAGRYFIDGRMGHISIRAINRKIPGLYLGGAYGKEGYFDGSGVPVQERPRKFRYFLNSSYLHFTHLVRSSLRAGDLEVMQRKSKLKRELGKKFPLDFYYPEVFFRPRPSVVPSPWEKMNCRLFLKSAALTLPRKVKRRIIKGPSGY